jgi:hypothetical protein
MPREEIITAPTRKAPKRRAASGAPPSCDRSALLEAIGALRENCRPSADLFPRRHASALAAYRKAISEGLNRSLRRLRQHVQTLSHGNAFATEVSQQISSYVDWLQWSLWDLPFFGVALHIPVRRFRTTVIGCALTYLSARVFDDLLDRHFWYKGKHPTLMNIALESPESGTHVEALTLLGGLLLCFHGLDALCDPRQGGEEKVLRTTIGFLKETIVGTLMERSPSCEWDSEF